MVSSLISTFTCSPTAFILILSVLILIFSALNFQLCDPNLDSWPCAYGLELISLILDSLSPVSLSLVKIPDSGHITSNSDPGLLALSPPLRHHLSVPSSCPYSSILSVHLLWNLILSTMYLNIVTYVCSCQNPTVSSSPEVPYSIQGRALLVKSTFLDDWLKYLLWLCEWTSSAIVHFNYQYGIHRCLAHYQDILLSLSSHGISKGVTKDWICSEF